ncbi:putative GTP diphosphokinase CRSH, chloroplastic [Glycine soja]
MGKEADHCVKMVELIEYNLEDVDAAILVVRVALAKGMNWDDLARMVKEEKKVGNPVAGLIDKLHLDRNCMTLLLNNNLDEMDDDEKTLPVDKSSGKSITKEETSSENDALDKGKKPGSVEVIENGKTRPLMEIQIRTTEMDRLAVGGIAAHSLYKAGLTDPEEAKRLKTIMLAATELTTLCLKDFLTSTNHKGIEIDQRDRAFCLLDKNGDDKISIEELTQVMEELGAPGEDAREMMQLLDSNSDDSLSYDEFHMFQEQDMNALRYDLMELKPTLFARVPRVFEKNMCFRNQESSGRTQSNEENSFWHALQLAEAVLLIHIFFFKCSKLGWMKKGYKHRQASRLADLLAFKKLGLGSCSTNNTGGVALSPEVEEFLGVTTCAFLWQGYEEVPEMGYNPLETPPCGEICVRGKTFFTGYYKNPELTKEAIKDGWFHTVFNN